MHLNPFSYQKFPNIIKFMLSFPAMSVRIIRFCYTYCSMVTYIFLYIVCIHDEFSVQSSKLYHVLQRSVVGILWNSFLLFIRITWPFYKVTHVISNGLAERPLVRCPVSFLSDGCGWGQILYQYQNHCVEQMVL